MVINAAIVLFFFWYTQVMMVCVTYFQQSNLKGVLPLTSVQHVQKSILGLYMIWQKNAFIAIEKRCVTILHAFRCTSPSKTCHPELCIHEVESHWTVSQMMCSNRAGYLGSNTDG